MKNLKSISALMRCENFQFSFKNKKRNFLVVFCLLSIVFGSVYATNVLIESRKIVETDAGANDWMGREMAIDGDTLVVGVEAEDEKGDSAGAVYIFQKDQGGANQWGEVKKITASDASVHAGFGSSVAISGDLIVVGATGDTLAGTTAEGVRSGAAYVFSRDQGGVNNWGEIKKIYSDDPYEMDWFGASVAIAGDTIVVGAWGDDDGGYEAGAVYIFSKDNLGTDHWGLVKKVMASDASTQNRFGQQVATDGTTIIVAAPYADIDSTTRAGAVYVFDKTSVEIGKWTELKKITASDASKNDSFGESIVIDGDTVLVGAPYNSRDGSAYVFGKDQGGANNWGEVKKLNGSDTHSFDTFGAALAISGDNAIVGAWQHDHNGVHDTGIAYVFARNSGGTDNWGEVYKLTASDAVSNDYFGKSVVLTAVTSVVGAMHADVSSETNAGALYMFDNIFTNVFCALGVTTFGQCGFQ